MSAETLGPRTLSAFRIGIPRPEVVALAGERSAPR